MNEVQVEPIGETTFIAEQSPVAPVEVNEAAIVAQSTRQRKRGAVDWNLHGSIDWASEGLL